MADPITAADVQAFLGELGYAIPASLLDLILCVVNKIIPCLDGAGYDECTAKAHPDVCRCAHGDVFRCPANKIAGAPSGASRSFDCGDDGIPGCVTRWRNWIPAVALVNFRSAPARVGLFMVVGGC
ncbi:Uncharacterised protein [Klebsiella pneumoniae]|nr:Uncharacterised protein [Klebsiella pneumoniae]